MEIDHRQPSVMSQLPSLQRRSVSAERPYAVIREREACDGGGTVSVTTVFLTASECPVGCKMCDLWQNTLEHPTPRGAISRQIDHAQASGPRTDWIKLYNSGNFFDPNSIPVDDYEAIANRCIDYQRVVVENHPRFGRKRTLRFRDLLGAARLEVAVGLETVQPRWLGRLGKGMSRDQFDRYAGWLRDNAIDLRVFLIVGVPGIDAEESLRWARLSVRHAIKVGARHVSLIPARYGHGWEGQGDRLPAVAIEQLALLQQQGIDDAGGTAVVTIDLWDADPQSPEEKDSLHQIDACNRTQASGSR